MENVAGEQDLASCADALWARHAIFLPHERLLKRMGYLIRPITADFPIKAAHFEPWSIFACDVVMADICVAFQRVCETFKIVDLNPARSYGIFREEKGGRVC